MRGKEDGITQKKKIMGIVAYCYMTEIFMFLWEFYFCFEGWGWLL